MKANAAVMTGVNLPFDIREYEICPPPAGMAGMKLVASGICGTDVHIHTGKLAVGLPAIIGHEFVGSIDAISPEDGRAYGLKIGDNVIVDIACPCGECLLCREGDDANCVHMGVTNGGHPDTPPHFYGGYAEYNISPAKNLIKIPDGLDPKMVSVFACAGPTAMHAFHLAEEANCRVKSMNLAVVQGLGPVGAFAVMYLKALGVPNIVALSSRAKPERAALIRELGATDVFDLEHMTQDEIVAKLAMMNGGLGADLVFEASGNPKAVPQGIGMLRNRGVYLIPGQYSNSGTAEIHPQAITFGALRILGSSQYSMSDVRAYLSFLTENPALHAKILSLATAYPVENINKAMDDVKAGRNIKTILVP